MWSQIPPEDRNASLRVEGVPDRADHIFSQWLAGLLDVPQVHAVHMEILLNALTQSSQNRWHTARIVQILQEEIAGRTQIRQMRDLAAQLVEPFQ